MGVEAKSSWHVVNSHKSNSKEGPRSKVLGQDRKKVQKKQWKGNNDQQGGVGEGMEKIFHKLWLYTEGHIPAT